MTPRISSSCLRLVDMVGWVTPQASAARPKCRSLANASRSSSLSIKKKPRQICCKGARPVPTNTTDPAGQILQKRPPLRINRILILDDFKALSISGWAKGDGSSLCSSQWCGSAHATIDITSRSRGAISPEVCVSLSLLGNRGRREDRVRAAPAVSCASCTKENAHEHTGSAETLRPSPRNGSTAYSALPSATVFLAPSLVELLPPT